MNDTANDINYQSWRRHDRPTGDRTLAAKGISLRDWRIASLESVAAAVGVNVRKSGGSHVVFEHPGLAEALPVPARRPIEPIYIQRFARFIDAVKDAHDRD